MVLAARIGQAQNLPRHTFSVLRQFESPEAKSNFMQVFVAHAAREKACPRWLLQHIAAARELGGRRRARRPATASSAWPPLPESYANPIFTPELLRGRVFLKNTALAHDATPSVRA